MIRHKLRHHRRYLAYPFIILPLLLTSPTFVRSDHILDQLLDIVGLAIACGGQALRLWAWGTNPKPFSVRRFGPYGFIRHPLYVGNFFIALGLLVVFNAPYAYVVLSFLGFLYWSIASEEEERLEKKWPLVYGEYRTQVPRFVPWRGQAVIENKTSSFDLKQALRKERESICGFLAGAMALEAYEDFLAFGFQEMHREIVFLLVLSSLLGVVSVHFHLRKKKKADNA